MENLAPCRPLLVPSRAVPMAEAWAALTLAVSMRAGQDGRVPGWTGRVFFFLLPHPCRILTDVEQLAAAPTDTLWALAR